MPALIQIPKRFYDEHVDRELAAPKVVRSTKSHYFIEARACEELDELLDDARHYAEPGLFSEPELLGVVASARATADAIERALEA